MTYAIMQTGPEPPSAEQFQNAFEQVPGLTAGDAKLMAKDACGMLIKGLDLEQASAMKSAMASQGLETEAVEESALRELPLAKQLRRVEFTTEALEMDDLLGHIVPLEWNDILLIAAGHVRCTVFTTTMVDEIVSYADNDSMPRVAMTSKTKEAQADHWLLEIITREGAVRYRAVADWPETVLLFQCLGQRRTRDTAANFAALVKDLATSAPTAVLNHGAYCLCENPDPSFFYPSQTAFYREITWLLWMISSGRMQAGD